jgi:DnaJ-domain-containing protein 1
MLFGFLFRQSRASIEPGAERRGTEHFPTTIIQCDLGKVLDMSRTGLRVQVDRLSRDAAAGVPFELSISSPAETITARVRVERLRRVGPSRLEVGLSFVDIDPALGERLEHLARFGVSRVPADAAANELRRKLVAAVKLEDHYKTLGLAPSATLESIQLAFRELARQYHPDLNRSPDAEKIFCQINEAHRVLSHPERRAEYDRSAGHRTSAA